jgi:NAD(P)-dependent dehydrogenase (short-subunit alcohol dehydrogenase family)
MTEPRVENAEALAAQQPLERLVEPDEAALLEWLAGPDADAMTGAIIPVDGGLSI